jgi:putative hemolysin
MLDFYEVTVQEVMTPRVYIDAFPANITVKDAISRAMKFSHSRIPIYQDTIDNIQWMVTIRDLLRAKHKGYDNKIIEDLQLIQPLKIPLTKPIHSLLELFRKSRQHIAIVMDEYGGVAGIVSLEDIVEEVFGDIQDEIDNEKIAIVKDGNCRRVQGYVMLTDIFKFLHIEYKDI